MRYQKVISDGMPATVCGQNREQVAVELKRIGFPDYPSLHNPKQLGLAESSEFIEAERRKQQRKTDERLEIYEKELRLLSIKLSLTEERERRKIASEIHDGIGQNLALCSIQLSRAINSASPSVDLTERLIEIQNVIKKISEETRSLVFEISPPNLYVIGLVAALKELTKRIGQKYRILASFEDDGQVKPLDEDTNILLYKMVRELLINIIKHAQAGNMKVSIVREKGMIRITVADDGTGFNTHVLEKTGFGLFNIRKSLSYIGGSFKIASKSGSGTRITLTAPIKY